MIAIGKSAFSDMLWKLRENCWSSRRYRKKRLASTQSGFSECQTSIVYDCGILVDLSFRIKCSLSAPLIHNLTPVNENEPYGPLGSRQEASVRAGTLRRIKDALTSNVLMLQQKEKVAHRVTLWETYLKTDLSAKHSFVTDKKVAI